MSQKKGESFNDIIHSGKPVLVDFFATWCGPCRTMQPILSELSTMVGDDARILKIDVDRNPDASSAYDVRSVPTLILFKDGQVKWRQSGVVPARELKRVIDSF